MCTGKVCILTLMSCMFHKLHRLDLLMFSVLLYTYCLVTLSITERGVLKYSTIITEFSVPLSFSVKSCCLFFNILSSVKSIYI